MLIELNFRDLFNRAYFFKAFLAAENSLKIWKLPLEVYDAAQVSNTLFFCVLFTLELERRLCCGICRNLRKCRRYAI